MIKRGLCLFGLLVMYFLLLPSGSVEASETTGTWGNVTWIFESDTGALTFTSGGTLGEYTYSPWNQSLVSGNSISSITFTEEVNAPQNSEFLLSGALTLEKQLTSLTKINNIELLNLSNATSLYGMFYKNSSLTELDLSSWETSNVTNFQYMFMTMSNLTTLDISGSFVIQSAAQNIRMFSGDTKLSSITLGQTAFSQTSDGNVLPAISTTSGEYTGKWVGVSGNATGNVYDSSTEFMTNYTSDYSGTYVWQTLRTLEVKDSTIKTTDSWTAADNFSSATNTFGTSVDFDTSGITTSGTVDTKAAGTYEVTYTYGPLTKTATVTVEDVSAALAVVFLQESTVLSDYTLNLTGYKVWDTVDLTSVESLTNQIANLESLGYTVTSPASTDVTLDSAENSVQYTVTGALGLLVPENISFPSITYTGETQTLSSSSTGDLTVQDTLSTTDETGWSLQVAVTKALASGARLSYLNSNNQSTLLSSTNQTIASSESGSKAISEDWGTATTDAGIKLTLDGSVGVGNYSGTLTWTLQAGPEA